MTLCREIQGTMERVYAPAGLDVESCIVGRCRSVELGRRVGLEIAGDQDAAYTFLRRTGDDLRVAVYYGPRLIATLEAEDPRLCISHRNIHALIAFVEEITHAVHAALQFRAGRAEVETEVFAIGLEAQAKVDAFWLVLAMFRHLRGTLPDPTERAWVHDRLFGDDRFTHGSRQINRRYRLASRIARAFLSRIETAPPPSRRALLQAFAAADFRGKIRLSRGRS